MKIWTCLSLCILLQLAVCQDDQTNSNVEEGDNNDQGQYPPPRGPPPMMRGDRYPPPPREYQVNYPQDFPPPPRRGGYNPYSRDGPPKYPSDFKPPGPYEHSVSRYNRVQHAPSYERNGAAGGEVGGDMQDLESGENKDWRHCYVCSGMFPDRECELYPKYVTKGPGRINCTRPYCTVFTRYTPKKYLLEYNEDGEPTASRPLGPNDYEVTSIARECEEASRGNLCVLDGDDMGLTCYDTCTTSLCNNAIRKPSEDDFVHFRQTRKDEQSIPGEAEPTEPKPKDMQNPALSQPKFKQMPPPRDFDPANERPPPYRDGGDMKDMQSRDRPADGIMDKEERMMNGEDAEDMGKDRRDRRRDGGDGGRRGKPPMKPDAPTAREGEAGFSKSQASDIQMNAFSTVALLVAFVYKLLD